METIIEPELQADLTFSVTPNEQWKKVVIGDKLAKEDDKQKLVESIFAPIDEQPAKLKPFVIHLKEGSQPVKQKIRPLAVDRHQFVNEEIRRQLELKLIEPANGPWSSPLVIVMKSIGKYRMCVLTTQRSIK